MMRIEYQNNVTGAAHDITQLVTGAKWATQRRGSPGKLTITVLEDPVVDWTEGGVVRVWEGERGRFYGYVFQIGRGGEGTVAITAYDQIRYLKNKETYLFDGVRADQVLSRIAGDFKLKVGALPSTGYVIPLLVADGQPLLDTILKALDLTLVHGGRMFYLWDDFGSLRLSEVVRPDALPVLGTGSLATGYDYTTSIDGETYSKIKLVRDNKDTGKRDVYIAQDSGAMERWGVLQSYEKVDEGLNAAQIQQRCEQLLELYGRPQRTLSVTALDLPGLRAGEVVYIDLPEVAGAFLVEEVSHDWMGETMDVKVRAV